MPIAGVEWDEKKARDNILNHRVSFETAQYIFSDPKRLERYDRSENNTSGEERWQMVGKIGKNFFSVVFEDKGTVKRLITARVASKSERRSYNGYYQIDDKGWTTAE